MGILTKFKNFFYERDRAGDNFYWKNLNQAEWDNSDLSKNLQKTLSNPILNAVMVYVSRHFANVEFSILDENDTPVDKHWLLDRLNNPNPYQSKSDFLEQFIWYKYAFGFNYIYQKSPTGFINNNAGIDTRFYNLDSSLIEFPQEFKTKIVLSEDALRGISFLYDKEGENLAVTMDQVIPYYDLPNGLIERNSLVSPSRITSLEKPIQVIDRSYNAKNVAIISNGKEIISVNGGMATGGILEDEKKEIENRFNSYGYGNVNGGSIVTKADVKIQPAHIKLADLGLDDSIVHESIRIVNSFGIDKRTIDYIITNSSLAESDKEQLEVNFIQNNTQVEMDDFTNALNKKYLAESGLRLVGTYDHLPVMQKTKVEKYMSIKTQMEAFNILRESGVETNVAAEMVGLKGIVITEKPQNDEQEPELQG